MASFEELDAEHDISQSEFKPLSALNCLKFKKEKCHANIYKCTTHQHMSILQYNNRDNHFYY